MDKVSFPKGSLKFRRLNVKSKEIEKDPKHKDFLKEFVKRKKFIDVMEKAYPGKPEGLEGIRVPVEQAEAWSNTLKYMRQDRKKLKNIPSFVTSNEYEITFRHPMWSKFLGEIVVKSNRENLKDTLKAIAVEFKSRKDEHRHFRMKEKIVKINSLKTDIKYYVSGGTIYMPSLKQGVFMQFLKDNEKKIVFTPKIPRESGKNYVGIEIEFFCDVNKDVLGLALYDAGIAKNVTLKTDSSISTEGNKIPHELCIIAKEDEYVSVMKKVNKILVDTDAQVNKSCGMHVHLDMRNRDVEKAYQNLVSSQGILYRMNPKSRLDQYAKKIQQRDFNIAKGGDRYHGINPTAYGKHQTIEIRIHSGTIDFTKITNWIAILIQIASSKERIVKTFTGINTFCEAFEINDMLKNYIEERVVKFKIIKDVGTEIVPEAERGVA